ncbi:MULTISPECIES: zinc metallopeptidase [Crateriforma]|uniref:Putative neutral zinc metallopeptidase n=1 Tax=Crateriforma conspicua TaxID=2527996 RepID=A0A5C6FRI3_9PLAN|nr:MULTISPECIES: zinc metallopeptidase [Crateriforma]QDV64929.1 Putative neutral zinc metallopeptidase [Crateriforma conspicua]TWT70327.1 putative neutral zinc metallopeptidase [Crateriforma conspicua]TWU65697.1 putative neutral zinc metallopeptidase [Crateriforma conspicua]
MLLYFLFVLPPFLLGLYAQWRVKSNFSSMSEVPARMSGAEAARRMLDSGGLQGVPIEMVPGHLSDHYDPRGKVVRLSADVYNGRNMAALGVACHEAGHAFQDARQYAPLVIRNLAVPAASFGSGAGVWMLIGGIWLGSQPLAWIGVALFSAVVFFQLINLPVEFDASARAKQQLVDQRLIAEAELPYVSKVLNAAALTYVAATLQSVMTLAYYLFILLNRRD